MIKMIRALLIFVSIFLFSKECQPFKDDPLHRSKAFGGDINFFEELANNATVGPRSYQDKTISHKYQEVYGEQLIPYVRKRHRKKQSVKFLEIGIGCDETTGFHYGAGIDIWKNLFSAVDELWVAEYNAKCLEDARQKSILEPRVNGLLGNQESYEDLEKWRQKTKGNFDIIIDDGGHLTQHILKTFYFMFETMLAPGGLYFIEDIQVNGIIPFKYGEGNHFKEFITQLEPKRISIPYTKPIVLMEVISAWMQELITGHSTPIYTFSTKHIRGYETPEDYWSQKQPQNRIPLPKGVKSIFCYPEVCLIRKCANNDKNHRCLNNL